jgi:glyoxylase-like metal-dependent hydrolase (beta-lactamase superfamily II)
MPYLTEPPPPRGSSTEILPGIRRVVARNPSPMTYHGTNTYIVDDTHGTTVIDPGPMDEDHLRDVLEAASGRITRILLTHAHADHVGNAAALKDATGALIHSNLVEGHSFTPDVPIEDGETIAGMVAVHTPGHAPDHLCFARGDGLLFSGDHVMGWCSTVVGPPQGDMAVYLDSLRRLLSRQDSLYLPGHGPPLSDPHPFISDLLKHRMEREAEIEAALRQCPNTASAIATTLYAKQNSTLSRAAERNVLAHLAKLGAEGRVKQVDDLWQVVDPASTR